MMCTIIQNVDDAKRLLYDVYVKECGWDPHPNTGVWIDQETKMLLSKYDDKCIWFGIYDLDLVACARIVVHDKLEFEQFCNIDHVKEQLRKKGIKHFLK